MRTVLSWIYFAGLVLVVGVGLVAIRNWLTGENLPLWHGPLWVITVVAASHLLMYCERRGWITGVFWSRPKELERREQELAAERERILQEAWERKASL